MGLCAVFEAIAVKVHQEQALDSVAGVDKLSSFCVAGCPQACVQVFSPGDGVRCLAHRHMLPCVWSVPGPPLSGYGTQVNVQVTHLS